MNPRFENIPLPHGHSFACLEFKEPVFECPYHFHPEIEITHIVESRGSVMIGNGLRQFAPGDVFLIGANAPHSFHNSPDWRKSGPAAHSRVIQFRIEAFGPEFFRLPEMSRINALLARSAKGIAFCGHLREAIARDLAETAQARGSKRILGLLGILQRAAAAPSSQYNLISTADDIGTMSATDERRMKRVLDFIHANSARHITVDEAASVASLSPASFSRFFRRTTKQTFVRFVNTLRINHACERLAHTDETITEIAFAVGFGNLANFNRRFLEARRETPSAYRASSRILLSP